jgi:hypothetical protein
MRIIDADGMSPRERISFPFDQMTAMTALILKPARRSVG